MRVFICLLALFALFASLPAFARPGLQPGSSGEFPVGAAPTTALGTLAASMDVGDWELLATNNLGTVLNGVDGTGGGHILPYANFMPWNSTTKELFFYGADHGGTPKFISYSEATNTWTHESDPYWHGDGTHAFSHNAVDPVRGEYYTTLYNYQNVWRFDAATRAWSELPLRPFKSTITYALAWFPEIDSLFLQDGNSVQIYNRTTNSWGTPITVGTYPTPPYWDYHTIAIYNPVEETVLFGGGNLSADASPRRRIATLNAALTVTNLSAPPIDIGIQGVTPALGIDPVSGEYLQWNVDDSFWSYNVGTNTWTELPSNSITRPRGTGLISAAIPEYGVVLWITCGNNATDPKVWVYKHAE